MKHKPAPWLTDMHLGLKEILLIASGEKVEKKPIIIGIVFSETKQIKLFETPKLDIHTHFSRIKHPQNPYGTV